MNVAPLCHPAANSSPQLPANEAPAADPHAAARLRRAGSRAFSSLFFAPPGVGTAASSLPALLPVFASRADRERPRPPADAASHPLLGTAPCDDEAYAAHLAAAGATSGEIRHMVAACRRYGATPAQADVFGATWSAFFIGLGYSPPLVAQLLVPLRTPFQSTLGALLTLAPVLHSLGCPSSTAVALACGTRATKRLRAAAELLPYSPLLWLEPGQLAAYLVTLSPRRVRWLRQQLPARAVRGESLGTIRLALHHAFAGLQAPAASANLGRPLRRAATAPARPTRSSPLTGSPVGPGINANVTEGGLANRATTTGPPAEAGSPAGLPTFFGPLGPLDLPTR